MNYLRYLLHVPLLVLILLAYNLVMLFSDAMAENPPVIRIALLSQPDPMSIGAADMFVILGLALLYAEIHKATRAPRLTFGDHAWSVAVFLVFLVEFIAVPGAGTTAFFILMLMSLFDMGVGFTITYSGHRRKNPEPAHEIPVSRDEPDASP